MPQYDDTFDTYENGASELKSETGAERYTDSDTDEKKFGRMLRN